MKKLFFMLVALALLGVSGVPAFAQGQNTENGVNENARDKIDASEGVDNAESKMMEGRAKAEENTDQDISEKGKNVLEESE